MATYSRMYGGIPCDGPRKRIETKTSEKNTDPVTRQDFFIGMALFSGIFAAVCAAFVKSTIKQ